MSTTPRGNTAERSHSHSQRSPTTTPVVRDGRRGWITALSALVAILATAAPLGGILTAAGGCETPSMAYTMRMRISKPSLGK